MIGEFSLSMIIGLGVAALGVILWIVFWLMSREPSRSLAPA